MATNITTVIENQTAQGLTMKVANQQAYGRVTSVKKGDEYHMQLDINWTYQEFLLEDKTDAAKKLFINSDDCCDYERITLMECNGEIGVVRVLRKKFGAAEATPKGSGYGNWKFWLWLYSLH